MRDEIEVDHRFYRGPEIPSLLIPDLNNPLVGRKELSLLGGCLQMDQVLDRKAHALILLQKRPWVS